MFTATTADRTGRFVLPGASEAPRAGATEIKGTEARAMATAGELRCEEIHCEAPIFFRQPAGRAPHWCHAPGTAGECATMGGPAGEFHRYLQFDVFGPAFAHEFSVPGARADAIVQRIGSKKNVAIEVQHSPIDPEVVIRRHTAHQAAGVVGTVWIINSSDIGGRAPGGVILTSWVVDLLEACQMTPGGYSCTVVIYKDRRQVGAGETLRIVDRAEIGHDQDGRRTATVQLSADTISIEALRLFAAGKDRPREIPTDLEAGVRALDAMPTRRVKKIIPAWRAATRAA
jgi:hypothetical protein